VNLWLVEAGMADVLSYEPNTAHESTFSEAKRQAVASGAGLWGRCDGPDQPLE
jgi:endonuclease YncB( thermonuclease family)